MKAKFATVALFFTMVVLSSCMNEKEDEIGPCPNHYIAPKGYGIVQQSESLGDLFLFVGDDIDFRYFKSEADSVVAERTGINYNNLTLFLKIRGNGFEAWRLSTKIADEKISALGAFILDNTEWSIKHKASTELTHVWTSSINGNLSIIADKTLFGREPGENLSDHFNVWDVNSCVVSSPELENARIIYNAKDSVPVTIDDYFVQGSCLGYCYAFYLADIPEETYKDLTFTISIPVENKYYMKYYKDLETSSTAKLQTEEKILSASKTVYFGEMSELTKYTAAVKDSGGFVHFLELHLGSKDF